MVPSTRDHILAVLRHVVTICDHIRAILRHVVTNCDRILIKRIYTQIFIFIKAYFNCSNLEIQTHDVVVHVKAVANIKFKFEFFDEAFF